MTCYQPITAWRATQRTANGKYPLVFNPQGGNPLSKLEIPCGKCIGCRLDYGYNWATRMICEASLHTDNCFLTLTYNNHNLPRDLSLQLDHFQKFLKRLRKHIYPKKLRFFHCGEYGDLTGRPHYHAIIFGWAPDDKVYSKSNKYYSSPLLDRLWGYGYVGCGDVTFDSCMYVSKYMTKKLNGARAVDYDGCKPDYCTMSRRPGIGAEWIAKYYQGVYVQDKVILSKNKSCKVPKYYDKFLESINPDYLERIKLDRLRVAQSMADYKDSDRLQTKHQIKWLQNKQSKRSYEHDVTDGISV